MDKIIPIKAFNDNYIWILINSKDNLAVVVDPGDANPVIQFLQENNLTLVAILITHHHYDHCGGIAKLLQYQKAPVYAPANEDIAHVTYKLKDKDLVKLEAINCLFYILDVPGHTRGHIAYVHEQFVFCGDTLFAGGCGRLFEGTAEQMLTSLNKLACLPPQTKVYCAHEYTQKNLQFASHIEPKNKTTSQRLEQVNELRAQGKITLPSTIGLELATNPFLRCNQASVKQAARERSHRELTMPSEVFAVIRQWKDDFIPS